MPRKGTGLLILEATIQMPDDLQGHVKEAAYKAFSSWSRTILPEVKKNIPVYHGVPDPRRRPGFLRRMVGIVKVRSIDGMEYEAIGVPGAAEKGPAYHAWSALMAMETGNIRPAPLTIRARRKRVMTFPVGAAQIRNPNRAVHGLVKSPEGIRVAERGRKSWIFTKRVFRPRWTPTKRRPVSTVAWNNLKILKRYLTHFGVDYVRTAVRDGKRIKIKGGR